jgi:hypothetical protein
MRWVTIKAERVLYVDHGRETIACDRNIPTTIIVKLSDGELKRLCTQKDG